MSNQQSNSENNSNGAAPAENAATDAAQANELETQLTQAKAEAEKNKNDFLYLRAEFENYKRNAIKERSDLTKYGSERLARDLLSVLDNFERALETELTPESLQVYKKGIDMTASELKALLQKHGIQEMPALGQNFDPAFHEALSSEETADFTPGTVSRVFRKPYKFHEKLLRPGQVVIAKAKA